MRLIDANRAMEIVRDQRIAHPNAYHLTNYATLILQEAPTVDAAEVLREQWISVEERMPKPEQKVLVIANRAGHEIVTTGIYEDGRVALGESIWFWNDIELYYDEHQDDYIIPEGWWEDKEYNSDDECNHPIDNPVTHWMPLPEMPQK